MSTERLTPILSTLGQEDDQESHIANLLSNKRRLNIIDEIDGEKLGYGAGFKYPEGVTVLPPC